MFTKSAPNAVDNHKVFPKSALRFCFTLYIGANFGKILNQILAFLPFFRYLTSNFETIWPDFRKMFIKSAPH